MRIDLATGLLPIVGLNESGKTTILEAILFFDHYADESNSGRQLRNLVNLTSPDGSLGHVEALVTFDGDELRELTDKTLKEHSESLERDGHPPISESVQKRYRGAVRAVGNAGELTLRRRVVDQIYEIDLPGFDDSAINNAISRRLLAFSPWLRYFEDFRMEWPNVLSLDKEDEEGREWRDIIEQVFVRAEAGHSIYQLSSIDSRLRQSTIARAVRHLNQTLTSHWASFRLETSAPLTLGMFFESRGVDDHPVLSISVVESDAQGQEFYFNIADRSKGFYWFFNFVMNLEFNSKVFDEGEQRIVYLLDEPGSYLHAGAQRRLCSKLAELGRSGMVVYATHSQYLLDPDVIPVNSIQVAERDASLGIVLRRLPEKVSDGGPNALAVQPVIEALRIPSTAFEVLGGGLALVVEGLHDFYAYRMFIAKDGYSDVRVFPATGAPTLRTICSLLLATDTPFQCLWDNDDAGRVSYQAALAYFGPPLEDRLHLLPLSDKRSRRLEDLFDPGEMASIRSHLDLPSNASFGRTVTELFYRDERVRAAILESAVLTQGHFDEVRDTLHFDQ